MRFLLFVVLIISWSGYLLGQGQEYNYAQYTIADGLPTNYVYGVIEDDNGSIWAYTENGISKFDGYQFKNYSTLDGLNGNDVILMMKDSLGVLYANSFNSMITCIKQDSLFALKNGNDSIFVFSGVLDGVVYMNEGRNFELFNGKARLLNTKFTKLANTLSSAKFNYNILPSTALIKNDDSFEFLNVDTINGSLIRTKLNVPESIINKCDWNVKIYYIAEMNLNVMFNSNFLILRNVIDNRIEYYLWDEIFKSKPKDIALSVNYDGSYFLDTSLGTIQIGEDLGLINSFVPQNITDQYTLLRYYKDSKGNYWVGSEEGGLFFFTSREVGSRNYKSKDTKENIFKSIFKIKEKVFLVTDKFSLYEFDRQLELIDKLEDNVRFNNAYQLLNQDVVLSQTKNAVVLNSSELNINSFEQSFNIDIKSFAIDTLLGNNRIFTNMREVLVDKISNNIYFNNSNFLIVINFSNKEIKFLAYNKFTTLHQSSYSNRIYCSNFKNLILINGDSLEPKLILPDEICSIYSIDENNLLVGTINSGLYI